MRPWEQRAAALSRRAPRWAKVAEIGFGVGKMAHTLANTRPEMVAPTCGGSAMRSERNEYGVPLWLLRVSVHCRAFWFFVDPRTGGLVVALVPFWRT